MGGCWKHLFFGLLTLFILLCGTPMTWRRSSHLGDLCLMSFMTFHGNLSYLPYSHAWEQHINILLMVFCLLYLRRLQGLFWLIRLYTSWAMMPRIIHDSTPTNAPSIGSRLLPVLQGWVFVTRVGSWVFTSVVITNHFGIMLAFLFSFVSLCICMLLLFLFLYFCSSCSISSSSSSLFFYVLFCFFFFFFFLFFFFFFFFLSPYVAFPTHINLTFMCIIMVP